MSRNTTRVLKMMKKSPHCYWCGIKVIHSLEPPVSLPDNFATVDHIYSRKQKAERQKAMLEGYKRKDGYGVYYVLGCNKCNQERGRKANNHDT